MCAASEWVSAFRAHPPAAPKKARCWGADMVASKLENGDCLVGVVGCRELFRCSLRLWSVGYRLLRIASPFTPRNRDGTNDSSRKARC